MTRKRNRRSTAQGRDISGDDPLPLLSIAEADATVAGWFERYVDGLRAACRSRYGLQASDINDALQQTFVDAVEAVRCNTPIASPGGWLWSVACTHCYRIWLQKVKNERFFQGRERIYDPPGREDAAEDIAIRRERNAHVRKAIASLDWADRAVIFQRFSSESWEETAIALSVSVYTARGRFRQVLKKLKKRLKRYER